MKGNLRHDVRISRYDRLPKYSCLWRYGGDTINTASQMEPNIKPGRIHCSDRSEALLRAQAQKYLLSAVDISVKERRR